MHKFLLRIGFLLMVTVSAGPQLLAQDPTSVDVNLLNWPNQKLAREYTIAEIAITGVRYLDTAIVSSISGLRPGDKFVHPGNDVFAKAINNLWRQKLFSNVKIYITKIVEDKVWIEINLTERPRLGDFKFHGVKKSELEDLLGKVQLAKQTILTDETRQRIKEQSIKFYKEKGYNNTTVTIQERADSGYVNSIYLDIYVLRGMKVKVDNISFFDNYSAPDLKLKKQMKGTKEMTKLTLFPSHEPSPYGERKTPSTKEYMKDNGYLSISKTKNFLDPYFRFKLFSSAKYDAKKYAEDKDKILNYYNSIGHRDAQIVADTSYPTAKGTLNIDIKVDEGRRYYFGNIVWKGNAKYGDSLLNMILGIRKGDIYNIDILNRRLGKELSQEGQDISSLYMDDGYLFFRADAIETAVYNDTIDHEIRIIEGPQARIKNVTISGNDRTKDYVIRRELRTVPGELFRRSDLIRSQRELAALNYFNQETINPGVVPNADDGTVDINWGVEEKSSDQLELSAGWGGNFGLTGTLGVSFNNFSIKNFFKKSAWDPLPQGDGQKLSVRYQSNGSAFHSYNFSFTEPWMGGKKRNSFTVAYNASKYTNGYDYLTGRIDKAKSDTNYLKTNGFTISLAKQLKWPDDYFSLIYAFNYTEYKMKNYPIFPGIDNGVSHNVSFKLGLQRSSVFDPIFPRSGSTMAASVQFTPPYSYIDKDLVNAENPYETPEYHKWRFSGDWYVPIGRALGAEKNRQLVMRIAAKYGFMGRYNPKLQYSPFERFQVGDAGLTNNFGILGYDIIAHRGYPVYESSITTVNPDQQQATRYFTIFNKYTLEMRYPLVINQSSTIYGLAFFEAANGWYNFKEYNPFNLRRSIGVGMRFYLPMFGLLGFDYGIGLDVLPGSATKRNRFTFMLGFEPE